ncbi:tRNA 4-thiouridine(8) synthase ThiI [Paenibacillus sp. CAA11]|uniref:tRNA uracil 4-sulfurtransferase ThiI n=1 Tax=Paenibacillus sp. CAA11 TaxID=1532905 RepID=UPI000D3626AE|nr:tRNA uracil 4-sulfurtransferase ThiI [Paenibacillus sp. CAA11]AWB45388.1 tRNA 4-thiouridine(8) synthase ThiI [Paenibacillus sp. CAA11]
MKPNYDMLLLRFGEISVKGKNRSKFEKAAITHVKSLLDSFPKAKVIKDYGRLYIELNGESAEELIGQLKKVFGITSISPVLRTKSQLEDILTAATDFISKLQPAEGTRFKVNARRVWKEFPYSSQEMNKQVADPILKACSALKVDVHHPQIELRVEVREQATYLYSEVIPAAGGYPFGSNGKAMLLLSGGIDSPVAGWSAMRRGLEIECVHFHSYPFTSKQAEDKVIELAKILSGYSGSQIKLHLVPFTEVQTAFTKAGQDNLIITFMRRAMLRIATELAEKNKALAIVTGESLGQVASQTLSSMNVIGRATDLPLLRPLVMMDKEEIIQLSMKVGTYELSILPYEDCCTLFLPKSPTTNPNLRVVEKVEATLEGLEELIQGAVDQTETLTIKADGTIFGRDAQTTTVPEKWF